MNNIITKIKNIQLIRTNNLFRLKDSACAICRRSVNIGLAVTGGLIAAYTMYNNSDVIISKNGPLSEYAVGIKENYVLEGLSLGAGIAGYGITSYIGTAIAETILEQSYSARNFLRASVKNMFTVLPCLLLKTGISITKECIQALQGIAKLVYEWRVTTGIVAILISLYIDPGNVIEGATWVYENYESLLKIYDVVDKGLIYIMAFFMPFIYWLHHHIAERMNGIFTAISYVSGLI